MTVENEPSEDVDWSEDEYLHILGTERRTFAWVLRAYGNFDPDSARDEALKRYPYESPDAPYRGMIFHDEAWHWAMLHLHGEGYWRTRPDLSQPPPECDESDFD